MSSNWATFSATFLACSVESVEALTIVLAAGTARKQWRSAMLGVGAAVAVLTAIVAALGPAVTAIPLRGLRLGVGALLLVFGLQWLRKAILRGSGFKALHDEAAIFARELSAAQSAVAERRRGVEDWYAFTLSFKGVLLEGLEVAFIVLTFGSNAKDIPLASIAAAISIVAVVVLGLTIRAPLTRVPENSMKFVVGVMLTAFGMFWGGEGAGAKWPGNDAAIPVLAAAVAIFALGLIAVMRRAAAADLDAPPRSHAGTVSR
ncbi:MAG: TMEM165/GDT1 family protein [Actinomycetota bacterium]|nr:TMEM165/GDT1 family protein [Actinomycetota bacterium]